MNNTLKNLYNIDNQIWDELNIMSGSDMITFDGKKTKLWFRYVYRVAEELEKKNITKVSEKDILKLEDSNYHSMIKALKELVIA